MPKDEELASVPTAATFRTRHEGAQQSPADPYRSDSAWILTNQFNEGLSVEALE